MFSDLAAGGPAGASSAAGGGASRSLAGGGPALRLYTSSKQAWHNLDPDEPLFMVTFRPIHVQEQLQAELYALLGGRDKFTKRNIAANAPRVIEMIQNRNVTATFWRHNGDNAADVVVRVTQGPQGRGQVPFAFAL